MFGADQAPQKPPAPFPGRTARERGMNNADTIWLTIGFAGQLLFTSRFLVQWIASERLGRSIVPLAFWWFSLAGGTVLLAYAVWRRDPVFAIGQASGLVIYARNLMLIARQRRQERPA